METVVMTIIHNRLSTDLITDYSRRTEEPEWLLNMRLNALEIYKKLPIEMSPLYKKQTLVNEIEVDNAILFNDSSVQKIINDPIGNIQNLIVNIDSETVEIKLAKELKDIGVFFADLNTLLNKHYELAKKYLKNRILKPEEDKYSALNHALFNNLLFIYIPPGIEILTPLRNINYLTGTTGVFTQTIIVVSENSKATFIEEIYPLHTSSTQQFIHSNITEVYIDRGSELTYISIENQNKNSLSFLNRKASIGEQSALNWVSGHFGGSLTRSRFDADLNGQGANIEDIEVSLSTGNQRFDITANLNHRSPVTIAHAIIKSVVKDQSRSISKGVIKIERNAKNSSAYLAEHAMIMNDARANTIPALEIENNEVKATHSAYITQVDEEQLFYLMSRGFDRNNAIKMVALGFFEPAIDRIPIPTLRIALRHIIDKKWSGIEYEKLIGKEKIFEELLIEESTEEITKKHDIFEGHYKYR
ncbi:MAG: Fe-S cluster assembly protein SufD [Thermoprotei archaeon]